MQNPASHRKAFFPEVQKWTKTDHFLVKLCAPRQFFCIVEISVKTIFAAFLLALASISNWLAGDWSCSLRNRSCHEKFSNYGHPYRVLYNGAPA